MDWTVFVIAAVAAIGAYIAGRWHEKGRIDAISKDLTKVVEQEAAKAFAQEQSKQQAIAENLQNLDTQMRTLTTTQEQIKSQISGDLWHRQMIWNQRRDPYVNLIKALHGFVDWAAIEIRQREEGITPSRDHDFHKILDDLREAEVIAEIFASPAVSQELSKYYAAVGGSPTKDPARLRIWNEAATRMYMTLLAAARKDLRIEAAEPSRTSRTEKSQNVSA